MRGSAKRNKTSKSGATERRASRADQRHLVPGLVSVLLVALVWIVFGQTLGHEFVNYDDQEYVYENPRITNGLSLDGIQWAFSHTHSGNWHPLTTISHMLDCQLFGLQPWGHHLTNVVLHTAATLFLFLALWELTGAGWPSAFVAALFAIHPLHVESVAWVAERKDVLSGVFFVLTLWAYARYVRSNRPTAARYLTVMVFFVLGLLCKPTLVTLPFVLLLLDYWPLRRFAWQSTSSKLPGATRNHGTGRRLDDRFRGGYPPAKPIRYLLIEKIPFLVLSAASCVATLLAQEAAVATTRQLTYGGRVGNAVVSYVVYLGQMIWPADLAVFYPFIAGNLNMARVTGALVVLLIISVAFFIWRGKYAFLWIGWLWYLGTLVPMIGLVQVGEQAHADRYTYLSQIGLYLLATWGAMELLARWRRGREVLIAVAVLIVTGLTAKSYVQTSVWRNSETLWNHAFAHTTSNHVAQSNLGRTFLEKGQLDEAIVHFRKALEIYPDYPEFNDLGDALMKREQLDEAVVCFQKAIEIYPDCVEAYANLGNVSLRRRNLAEAIAFFRTALRIRPDYLKARNNLGITLAEIGKTDEALTEFRAVLRMDRDFRDAHCNLALLLVQLGRRDEALIHLREALRLDPNDAKVLEQLRQLGVEK